MKRGQVTVYIIVGIVALVISGIILFVRSDFYSSLSEETMSKFIQRPQEIENLNNQIKVCISNLADEVLYAIGQQGGYSDFNDMGYDEENMAPYYFYFGMNKVISKRILEEEISSLLDSQLSSCIIEGDDLEIKYSNVLINTEISDEVSFNIDWDIEVFKDGVGSKLDSIIFSKKIDLLKLLDISNDIVSELIAYPEGVCVSCISDIALENDVNVEIFFNKHNLLIKILTNQELNGEPYVFVFSNRFEESLT